MDEEQANRPKLRLRAEARPVWLNALAADQQRAFGKLIDLIRAGTLDLPELEEWKRDPEFDRGLDERRTSRVLLLGGGRGSGKTSVASTLQMALGGGGELYDPDLKITPEQERFKSAVDDLRKEVIVLEPLSMEDTPSETNILAALLARIEQNLFPKLTHEDAPSTSGDQRRHDAVLELLRLQTDVAIAWNGNLSERKGQLDPDNYAMEELRVERVRLQLRNRFATALRRTARDSLGHDVPVLFLLIVDDADVNPAKLMDLLERLRMVAVVEILVLLVGDIGAIETAFRLHFATRFRLEVEPRKIGMDPKELSSLTHSIGQSALRKHVPYHQRVLLQPLEARETVGLSPLFRPYRSLDDMLKSVTVSYPAVPHWLPISQEERAHMHSLEAAKRTPEQDEELKQIRTKPADPMPLNTFIYPKADFDEDSEEDSWYVGSHVLADSPRVAIDLWNTLRDADASEGGVKDTWADGGSIREGGAQNLDPRLHTLIRQLAAERLDAKTDLWDPDSPVDDALRETIVREGNLDALDLLGTHHVHYVSDTPRCLEGDGVKVDDYVYWSRHDGLQFEVLGKPASRREIGPLVLVEDLWSLENRTAAEQAAAERRRSDLIWVVSQSPATHKTEPREQDRLKKKTEKDKERSTTTAEAHGRTDPSSPDSQVKNDSDDNRRPKDRSPTRMGTPWPVPMYRTTRQVEQFGYMWNAFLSKWEDDLRKSTDKSSDQHVDALVNAWIACHTRSLLGAEPAQYVPGDPSTDKATPPNEARGSEDTVLPLADGVEDTKEWLRDLAHYLGGRDEWAATIACDWFASVGWLLDRFWDKGEDEEALKDKDEELLEPLKDYVGADFLDDHPVCKGRIEQRIKDLKTQAEAEDRGGSG